MGNEWYDWCKMNVKMYWELKLNGIDNIIGRYHSWRLKFSKKARRAADNSTYLHSKGFEINTGRLERNESFLFPNSSKKLSSL